MAYENDKESFSAVARQLLGRATDEILASRSGRVAVNAAAKGLQQGKRYWDEHAPKLAGTLGLATSEDVARVQKRLAKLKKRLRRLLEEESASDTPR